MKNVAIIGAGLGGLSAGALLAKNGYKVTILEQHNIVGGCATTFKRKGGFTCEVGLHEMDGVYSNKVIKEIFEELGVYENVEFVKPNEFFRMKMDGFEFVMPDNLKDAKEKLIKIFPDSQKSVIEYFDIIENISNAFETLSSFSLKNLFAMPSAIYNILKYKDKSLQDVFDKLFNDEYLKIILNTNMNYYHDNTKELNFLLHAVAQHSYFTGHGWFIKGGSQKLSDYLASVVLENGGTIITKAMVESIENNSLTYSLSNQKQTLEFDKLISNISPMQTYEMAGIKHDEEKKQIAESLLTIYLGFSKNLKEIYKENSYSNFFLKEVHKLEDFNNSRTTPTKERGFAFIDYSQIDSALTKDNNKSFGVLTTVDYLRDWKNLSEKEYKEQKEIVLESFLNELEKEYPNIKEYIEYREVATAKTMQRYLKTPNGTAYGFAPSVQQFFKVPQTKSPKMKNLYFVGQWVIGGGFSPALTSGKLCYDAIAKS
jgi:all-trans-retinol 13,14-reductase